MAMENVWGEESPGQAEEKKSAKKSVRAVSQRWDEKQDNVVDQGKPRKKRTRKMRLALFTGLVTQRPQAREGSGARPW